MVVIVASSETRTGVPRSSDTATPPYHHHRALGIVLLYGPRGGLFLMSEVPMYIVMEGTVEIFADSKYFHRDDAAEFIPRYFVRRVQG